MDPLPYPRPLKLQTDSGIGSKSDDRQSNSLDCCLLSRGGDSLSERAVRLQTHYEVLLDSIDGIVWEADSQRAQFTFVSAQAERLLGYPIDAWQQPNFWLQHLYLPDRDRVLRLCQQAHQNRQKYEVEYRLVGTEGQLVWLHEKVTLVRDASGHPTHLIGVAMNITDRKHSESELHTSHSFLQTVLDHLPLAVFVEDGRPEHFGKLTFWNQTAERLFGWTEKMLGKTLHQALPQKQADQIEFNDRQSFQQQHVQEHPEEIVDTATLGRRLLQTLRIPLFNEQQQPQYLLKICQDITEQQQADLALRQRVEQEALMASISRDIRQSLDLNTVLTTTVAEVRRFLQTDRVLIFRFRPGWSGTVLVESVDSQWEPLIGKIFNDPCFTDAFAAQYQQGHTRAIADVSQEQTPSCYQQFLAGLQARAILTVPILQQSTLWGLLIAHHCSEPRDWQSFEVDLLKQLSTQVGSAIEQSELYQQVQRLNADLERQVQIRTAELHLASEFEATLKRITDRVRDSLDEDQILQTAIRELAVAIGVVGCNASIYDLENRTSKVSYEYTDSLMRLQGRVVNMNNFSEGYRQLLEGLYFQFCSLVPNPLRGYVAMFACPIVDDQGVLGDLWLVSQKYRAFNEQDIRLVQQVANQCAIAIRQARLYQEAQTQVLELEKLNGLKDDFLSTVSHELRTPMSNIKLAAQMLEINLRQKNLLDNSSTGLSRYFHILKNECQREINLINDLLDLSRLETGENILNWEKIDLKLWLSRLIQPFLARTHNQQQTLELDIPADLPLLMTDSSHLERVISELLSNACKYTPAGGKIQVAIQVVELDAIQQNQHTEPGTIQPGNPLAVQPNLASVHSKENQSSEDTLTSHLTPDCLQPSERRALVSPPLESRSHPLLQIHVSNSGVEILPDELTRIFDKFYRIPNNDPWKHGGTGLGLALVKKLVEALGGAIWARSGGGQTCFTVNLPLHDEVEL